MKTLRISVLFSILACAVSGAAATLIDLPVSSVTNRAYLTDMPDRPWWNKAWTRRAPILVGNRAIEPSDKAIVDVVVDFGEEVKPEDVRVVTPWGTLVDCVAERVRRTDTPVRSDGNDTSSKLNGQECPFSGTNGQECPFSDTAIRLLFTTELRIEENKPFFVYWNRRTDTLVRSAGEQDGTDKSVRSPFSLSLSPTEVRMNNGVLDVVFDNLHRTSGLLKSLRVVGSSSRNELLERASGYAWKGFDFFIAGFPKWGPAKVVRDNAFVKQIRFESDKVDVDFILYAEQSRLDYAYRLKGDHTQVFTGIAWACGGGTAFDDLYYPCLTGEMRKLSAGLNACSDCIPTPLHHLTDWVGEGWYAIADRETGNVVGQIFDRAALTRFDFNGAGQSAGEDAQLAFNHVNGKDKARTGAGALYASVGKPEQVRREYRRLNGRPVVLVGKAEAYAEHPVRVPRLDRDFCMDFNIGKDSGAGWSSGMPLEGRDWCENICDRLQSYGANVVRIGGYRWTEMPMPKDLYDRYNAVHTKFSQKWAKPLPPWQEGVTGEKFREHCEAAHARGMAVSLWLGLLAPGWQHTFDIIFDQDAIDVETDYALLFPKTGADCVYVGLLESESPLMPEALEKANGKTYWTWKNPREYFTWQHRRNELQKRLYKRVKASGVDKPVMTLHSEDGELWREMFGAGMAGSLDTIYCEMMPVFDNPTLMGHVKHVAKRLRASWNNEPGHTVHNHFYYMNYDYVNRIHELEVPFINGVNGFSFENLTYENFSREASQITADFYRFASYTKLGEKVAKMGPVKNLAVFRDSKAFEEDIAAGRNKDPYPYQARQDGRVNTFAQIFSFNYDVVIEKYFTAKDLAQYKVVYIPEDVAFSKELAEELLEYVKQGGGAIVEGATCQGEDALATKDGAKQCGKGVLALARLGLKDGEVTPLGKGKIVWVKDILTDRVAKWDLKAHQQVKDLVAAVGGVNPLEIKSLDGRECPRFGLDGVLQASDEGMFLGVYNRGNKEEMGIVTIDLKSKAKVEVEERNDKFHSSPSPSSFDSLYVLDVKNGIRFPYTNTFEIAVGPEQCGFYLIGDDTFTALPEVAEGVWTGPSVASANPQGNPVAGASSPRQKDAFRPAKAVEIVGLRKGQPVTFRRSAEAAIDVTSVTEENYNARKLAKALAEATYVHVAADASVSDLVFADCAEQLKALLKRGGAILFDKSAPGEKAQAFLKEVGVFDPFAAKTKDVVDREGQWNASVSTNSPLRAKQGSFQGLCCGDYSFGRWDKEKQYAPYVLVRNAEVAQTVVQEKVLGAGKVIFDCHVRAFTDWYENRSLGDALVEYMIGLPPAEHAQKVRQANGGPGEKVL